jgi:protein TonB
VDLPENQRFEMHRRRTSWPLAVLIVLMHLAVLYGLALTLAPQMTAAVRPQATAAFSITPPPPAPAPPATPAASDRSAQGDPGRDAIARPAAAPPPRLPVKADPPLPRAASTGIASLSGAAAAGEGRGAAGRGAGTGSGKGGEGRGGSVAAGPVHIAGAIDNARDFPLPEGGRAARRGTQVIVRVTIGTDGRARDCAIIRPSPDPEADRITCRLVESRLGFRPARDASGNPVPAPFYWRQQWF